MWILLVMLFQQIFTKVVFEISKNRMDMIGIVLGGIVFQQKGRSLNAVIVAFAPLYPTGPGKVDLVESGLGNLADIFLRITCSDQSRSSLKAGPQSPFVHFVMNVLEGFYPPNTFTPEGFAKLWQRLKINED